MGDYRHGEAGNRIKAKRLLKELLPKARAEAAEVSGELTVQSGTAAARGLFEHLTEDNVEGIHVYRGPMGGWHADLTLRKVPLGLPSIIGTPSSMPCATRDEAVDAAVKMLVMVVAKPPVEHSGPEVGEGMIAFELDDVVLQLPRELVETIEDALGPPEPGYAERRLREIGKELPGKGPFTAARLRTFDVETMARLHSVVALAIIDGLFRWPPRTHAPPPGRKARH